MRFTAFTAESAQAAGHTLSAASSATIERATTICPVFPLADSIFGFC
ncbi:MAG: hypothetical protein MI861_17330 [Pirellulales bacterium]|nr:hypothetical protein [Pirellulales bacterium]